MVLSGPRVLNRTRQIRFLSPKVCLSNHQPTVGRPAPVRKLEGGSDDLVRASHDEARQNVTGGG
jgi:hypothetical protein